MRLPYCLCSSKANWCLLASSFPSNNVCLSPISSINWTICSTGSPSLISSSQTLTLRGHSPIWYRTDTAAAVWLHPGTVSPLLLLVNYKIWCGLIGMAVRCKPPQLQNARYGCCQFSIFCSSHIFLLHWVNKTLPSSLLEQPIYHSNIYVVKAIEMQSNGVLRQ